ncbi:MAG: hypothetical protein WKF37_06410 [Bryobacteraceae bacterium]
MSWASADCGPVVARLDSPAALLRVTVLAELGVQEPALVPERLAQVELRKEDWR